MTDDLDPVKLRALLDAVASLPRSVEPERDAWPAIRDRIEAQRIRPIAPRGASAERAPRRSRRLVAAAAVLVAVSSGLTVLALRGHRDASVTQGPAPVATPGASTLTEPATVPPAASSPSMSPDSPRGEARSTAVAARASTARAVDALFNRYDAAANDLTLALRQRSERMDPATVAVIDSCLVKIDAAIAEARAALRRDPQSAGLAGLLTVTYRQKLDLLKRAADLPARSL
jgi:hypothetical protein